LHPKTHKFIFFPWDQDQTFGQFPRGSTAEQRENLTIHRPWSSDSRFLERVFQSDEFKKLYLAKMEEFNSTILQPQAIRAQVDQGICRPPPQIRPGSACRQISGGNYFLRARPTTGETAAACEIGGGKIVAN